MVEKNKYQMSMSATRMQMYLQCKYKYYCNYVLHLPRKSNPAFKLGIAVHESLAVAGKIWQKNEKFTIEDIAKIKDMYNKVAAKEGIADTNVYHEGMQMVLRQLNGFGNGTILTVEDKFKVTTDDGVVVIGAMDMVEALDEETILVTDYKTSKYFESADELKADIQLSLYDAIASIKYPEYKRIILSLNYVRNEPVYTYRTIEERKGFLEYVVAVYNEMLNFKEEDAKPMLNDMCSWCDFTDNCKAYQEALSNESLIKKKLHEYSDEELVGEYIGIKSRSKLLYNREQQLKRYILEKIKTESQDLVGCGKQLYVRQNGRVAYDVKSVYESVSINEFLKMVSVSKGKVDEYLDTHPSKRAKIVESAQKNYTLPFLAYKNVK